MNAIFYFDPRFNKLEEVKLHTSTEEKQVDVSPMKAEM